MSCIVTSSTFWKRLSPRLQQALIARRDGKFKDAIQLLYDACEKDKDPEAMYFMAVAYELGGWKYVMADHKRAISWYVKAAQAGHAAAIAFVNGFTAKKEEGMIFPTTYNKTRDMLARGMELICEGDVPTHSTWSEFLSSLFKTLLVECNFHFSRFMPFLSNHGVRVGQLELCVLYFETMAMWNEQSIYLFRDYWEKYYIVKPKLSLCAELNVRKAKISIIENELKGCSTEFDLIRKYAGWIADEGLINTEMLDDNTNLQHMHLTEYYLYGERKLHKEAYRFYLSTNIFVQSRVFLWLWIGGKHLKLIKDVVQHIGKMVWKSRKFPEIWFMKQ